MNYSINNKKKYIKKAAQWLLFSLLHCANLTLDLLTIRHTVPALRADGIFVPL